MVGVCLVDQKGLITHMNASGSRLLGWGVIGPPNVSIDEVFDGSELGGEELANGQLLLDRLKEKKFVWFPQARLRCRQGTWCRVELKGVAIEGGEVTQFLVMFRDLSSETQLAEDYSRLASIPEESPFPIIEVNAAGHLLYANPSMVPLNGRRQYRPGWVYDCLAGSFSRSGSSLFRHKGIWSPILKWKWERNIIHGPFCLIRNRGDFVDMEWMLPIQSGQPWSCRNLRKRWKRKIRN